MSRIEPRIHACKDGAPILIRVAEHQDASRLLDMAREVMAERDVTLSEWDESDLTIEKEQKWIQDALDHSTDLILVAEVSGQVVGILNFSTEAKRKTAHTGEFGMSVVTQLRDRGIGAALLATLIEWATAHSRIEKIDLAVFASNSRAIHLYGACGFHEEGRRKKAVKLGESKYDDLVLMSKFIRHGD